MSVDIDQSSGGGTGDRRRTWGGGWCGTRTGCGTGCGTWDGTRCGRSISHQIHQSLHFSGVDLISRRDDGVLGGILQIELTVLAQNITPRIGTAAEIDLGITN